MNWKNWTCTIALQFLKFLITVPRKNIMKYLKTISSTWWEKKQPTYAWSFVEQRKRWPKKKFIFDQLVGRFYSAGK